MIAKKERVVLFGAGNNGIRLCKEFQEQKGKAEVVAFVDDYKTGSLMGIPIIKIEDLMNVNFDTIFIASTAMKSIRQRLLDMGIEQYRIAESDIEKGAMARETFLKRCAEELNRREIKGNVAEAGVFQGDFAAVINKAFPERMLYLFDTFVGFDKRDTSVEKGWSDDPWRANQLKETSVELVLSKMAYPDKCIIKQGYIPETFQDIDDCFCFVNLDMDLYQPTWNALQWFWPRMVENGVVLIHDYYDKTGVYSNLKDAVKQFVDAHAVKFLPIGDDLSVALIK